MRHIICLLLFVMLCTSGSPCLAMLPAAPPSAPAVLTSIRWSAQTTAVPGTRIVIAVSGPIQIESALTTSPAPQLLITIKGALPGSLERFIRLDGSKADNLFIDPRNDRDSLITIALPVAISANDYKIFTLAKEPENNQPLRIVIDINSPALSATLPSNQPPRQEAVEASGGDAKKTVLLLVAWHVRGMFDQTKTQALAFGQQLFSLAAPRSAAGP